MEITPNVILCVNLLDEAKKKKIKIDFKKLSKLLGIPVVGTIARKKHTLDNLMNTILKVVQRKLFLIQYQLIIQLKQIAYLIK